MIEVLDARVVKDDEIILLEDTKEDRLITSFVDVDNIVIEEPAKDIWAWGLISQRYLPHVR